MHRERFTSLCRACRNVQSHVLLCSAIHDLCTHACTRGNCTITHMCCLFQHKPVKINHGTNLSNVNKRSCVWLLHATVLTVCCTYMQLASRPLALYRRPYLRPNVLITQHSTSASATDTGNSYLTLKQYHQAELEVKKSKFIATAWPVTTGSQALQYVSTNKDQSASHNCYAYKSGQVSRCSDDGEPSSTAGQPILSAILAEQLDGVCVMVTRFFGGTKLGTGGLARAYGGAARECLQSAEKVVYQRQVTCHMQAPFSALGPVYSLLDKHNAQERSEDYLTSADVRISCQVAADAFESLQQDMLDATSGTVKAKLMHDKSQ